MLLDELKGFDDFRVKHMNHQLNRGEREVEVFDAFQIKARMAIAVGV
jgi:hypothetical protein